MRNYFLRTGLGWVKVNLASEALRCFERRGVRDAETWMGARAVDYDLEGEVARRVEKRDE